MTRVYFEQPLAARDLWLALCASSYSWAASNNFSSIAGLFWLARWLFLTQRAKKIIHRVSCKEFSTILRPKST